MVWCPGGLGNASLCPVQENGSGSVSAWRELMFAMQRARLARVVLCHTGDIPSAQSSPGNSSNPFMRGCAAESASASVLIFPGQLMDVSLCPHSLLLHCTEALCSCLHCQRARPALHCFGHSSDSPGHAEHILGASAVTVTTPHN